MYALLMRHAIPPRVSFEFEKDGNIISMIDDPAKFKLLDQTT
jgi:hypothetical protein